VRTDGENACGSSTWPGRGPRPARSSRSRRSLQQLAGGSHAPPDGLRGRVLRVHGGGLPSQHEPGRRGEGHARAADRRGSHRPRNPAGKPIPVTATVNVQARPTRRNSAPFSVTPSARRCSSPGSPGGFLPRRRNARWTLTRRSLETRPGHAGCTAAITRRASSSSTSTGTRHHAGMTNPNAFQHVGIATILRDQVRPGLHDRIHQRTATGLPSSPPSRSPRRRRRSAPTC